MPTLGDGAALTPTIPPEHSKQASYNPTGEEAANAKSPHKFPDAGSVFPGTFSQQRSNRASHCDG